MFSAKVGWFLIGVATILAEPANPQQVSYAPNAGDYRTYGVEAQYPSYAGFENSVRSLIGSANFTRFKYPLQFCLLLTNNSAQAIILTTLRLQSTRGNEPPAYQTVQLNGAPSSDGAQQAIEPRSTAILGPTTLITRAVAAATTRALFSTEATPIITDLASRFQTFQNTVLSLDSIVFPDGTVVGPDFWASFTRTRNRQEKSAICSTLPRLCGTIHALEAALRPIANLSRDGDFAAGVRQHYRMTQRAMAEFLLFRRTNNPTLSFETIQTSVPFGPSFHKAAQGSRQGPESH